MCSISYEKRVSWKERPLKTHLREYNKLGGVSQRVGQCNCEVMSRFTYKLSYLLYGCLCLHHVSQNKTMRKSGGHDVAYGQGSKEVAQTPTPGYDTQAYSEKAQEFLSHVDCKYRRRSILFATTFNIKG